jgi:multidrug efflux system membrane fusion protein
VVSGRDDAGEDRVTIPAGAALEGENGSAFVWVVDPDSMQVRRVPVTLGQLTGSSVEIRGDLQKGVWVAVSGVHQLREGMEVRRLEN